MKRFFVAAILSGAFLTGACGQSRGGKSTADPGKLSAIEAAYKAGVLSKEEYEMKKRELEQTAARPKADPAQLSALESAFKAGVLTKEEYEAKKRELEQGGAAQVGAPAGGSKADPAQLSAIETAYKAGVLTREEYEARKRELEGQGTAGQATVAGGWSRQRHPRGFELEHPAGWSVDATDDMRITARSQSGASLVLVTPFVRGGASCRQYLTEALASSGLFPQAQITSMQQQRQQPDEVVAGFTFRGGQSRGAAMCSLYRGSGMLFAIAAPAGEYERQKQDLVRIVRSVSFSGGGGQGQGPGRGQGPARPPMQYARFVDPREGAFTTEVPAGWRTEGGLLRRSAIDVTSAIRASAPDGTSVVFLGDERLFNCVTPEIFGGLPGMSEGQMYDSGAGTRVMILRFQPPLVFGMNYMGQLQRTWGLTNISIKDRRDRPDIAEPVNRRAAQMNANPLGPSRTSIGEIAFSGQRNGRPVTGYLFVQITASPWMNGGVYWTPLVAGFITPEERAAEMYGAALHMAQSYQVNPQWSGAQQRTTMNTSDIYRQNAILTNETITKSYWATQAANDRVFQADSDARRGQVRLKDPQTGEEFTATAGHNYYYRPMGGDERHIFGTDNTDRPNIDATELLIVR